MYIVIINTHTVISRLIYIIDMYVYQYVLYKWCYNHNIMRLLTDSVTNLVMAMVKAIILHSFFDLVYFIKCPHNIYWQYNCSIVCGNC